MICREPLRTVVANVDRPHDCTLHHVKLRSNCCRLAVKTEDTFGSTDQKLLVAIRRETDRFRIVAAVSRPDVLATAFVNAFDSAAVCGDVGVAAKLGYCADAARCIN